MNWQGILHKGEADMNKYKVGDIANGQETSEKIIEAENELQALRKIITDANLYCITVEEDTGHNAVALSWWEELSEAEKELLIAMLFKMDELDFQAYGITTDKNGDYIEEE